MSETSLTVQVTADVSPAAMRVLHVTQPVTEGVGHYVRLLVAGQQQRGYRVGLACAPASGLAAESQRLGAAVLAWEARRDPGPSVLAEVRRLRAVIRHFDPDVVHLHSSKAGMVGRLALRGAQPTVFQPNAWSFEAANGPVKTAALAWERRAARWTDLLVMVSNHELQQAAAHRIAARQGAIVVPNPVNAERFRPLPESSRAGLRRRLRLPPGRLVVCVGRLCQQKGQDVLLAAWPGVAAAVTDAQLVLVGDGPMRAALERRAPPSVRFLGLRQDVPELLQAADLVVLPSRWEGMALTMLEAMATARSVVTTRVGGAEETVGRDAGAVVEVGDAPALTVAITRRLLDPELARAEGRQGRRIAASDHTIDAVLTTIDAVYRAAWTGAPVSHQNRRAVAPFR
jgi:glycosyltransferase involved in cell wall biosynthesis